MVRLKSGEVLHTKMHCALVAETRNALSEESYVSTRAVGLSSCAVDGRMSFNPLHRGTH